MVGAHLIGQLVSIAGADAVLQGETVAPHCRDWRGRYAGEALAAVFPADTAAVSAVVTACAEAGAAIVPQGGNTSLCGASVPAKGERPQVIVNLSRMNRIRALDATNYTLTVEAGCTLARIYEVAERADRLFPLGLTAIAPQCEIGGNLSTNAGGIGVLRYGSARDLVLGLEVVLPDGRIWNGLRRLRKDNTGYDLKQLFLGAEGTLGIITAAVLKLYPRPQASATAIIALRDPATAVALLAHLRRSCGETINAFELISRSCLDLVYRHIEGAEAPFAAGHDWLVLARLSDVRPEPLTPLLSAALQSFGAGVLDFKLTDTAEQAERWWLLRKNIAEAQKREGLSIKHDVSVAVSLVAQFIERAGAALQAAFPGVRIVAFGHMGDGNIHYNVSMPDAEVNRHWLPQHEAEVNRIVYGVVAELEGSISAEHGLGQLKRVEITRYKSALELELMRGIKDMLDPDGRMNPGKVLL